MADLRIVDAPLLSTVKGTEKIPTGGEGNFSVSVNQVADFAKLKWFLATEGYVDNAVGNVQADLNLHKNNESNPHQVTKAQVGLGNVDNTADLDKPVSNATQSAIITANSGKADKVYVDNQDTLKADKLTTYTKTETDTLIDIKADKSTTLGGYNISDAYTKSAVDILVVTKADKLYVDTKDQLKADKTYTDSQLALKADKTYVDSQDSSLQSQIDQKATEEYLDNALAEQTNTVNTALSNLSTVASKFYPTLAEANADITNIAVTQVVNIGEVTNGGLWYKATAGATSLTKSPYDPLVQSKDAIAQNLLFDPFNDTVTVAKVDSMQSTQNAEFSSIVTSSTFNKPALRGNAGVQVRRYLDVSKMHLNTNKFYVRVHANYATIDATAVISVYLRKSNNTVIAEKSVFAVTGDNDIIFDEMTSTADAHHLLIVCAGASVKDLNAVAVSFTPKPRFIYGSVYANYYKDIQAQIDAQASNLTTQIAATESKQQASIANLLPDPFFRSLANGIKIIDGFPLITESEVMWSVVDYAASPFIAKKAIFKSGGSAALNRSVSFKSLGLQAGDTLTFRTSITTLTGGLFQIAFYVRDSSNTIIGPNTPSQFTFTANVQREISHTVTITQAMIDSGATLNIRFNVATVSYPNGWYCNGMALYRNNTTATIQDNSYQIDLLREQASNVEVPHTYAKYYLRETHQRLQKLKLSEQAQLSIAIIGDSWTQNRDRWSGVVANQLISQFGDAGGGYTSFAFHPDVPSIVNENVRSDYTVARSGAWSSAYSIASNTSPTPDICKIWSSEVGAKITCTTPATPNISECNLFYIGTSDGVARYRFNGGSWSTLNLNAVAVDALGIVNLTGFGTGAQTLEIEVVSGTCSLGGVNWKSNNSGVVVHKLGASGSKAQNWALVNESSFKSGLSTLVPNLVIIMLGTNDQGATRTTAQFTSDMTTLIDRVKTARPLADVLVVMPCENNRTNNSTPMVDYTKSIYELCKTKKCAFLDLQKDFGDNPSEYAATSVRNWMNADLIHPDPLTGGRAIVDAVTRFMLY